MLGNVTISSDGDRAGLSAGGLKQRTVLGLLTASVGRPVTTDWLIEGVYGDQPPSGARRTVQTYVSNLRGLTSGSIEPSGAGYQLNLPRSQIDAGRFELEVSAAARIGDAGDRAMAFSDSLAAWRGFPYADTDAFHTIPAEVTRLEQLRLSTVEQRIDADLERGRHTILIGELEGLADAYPLHERFRAQHMVALYRSGRQVDALRAYERARRELIEETGLDPSPQLVELADQILRHDARLAAPPRQLIARLAILVADVAEDRRKAAQVGAGMQIDRIGSLLSESATRHGGTIFAVHGSATYIRFDRCDAAAAAASEVQVELARTADIGPRRVRIAIDVGDVEISPSGVASGPPVRRVALLVGLAHPGQVVLPSDAVLDLTEHGGDWAVRGLGARTLPELEHAQPIHQLSIDGLDNDFPPLPSRSGGVAPGTDAAVTPGYELRQQVAVGDASTTHRGYQPSVGREVEICVIRSEFSNQAAFVRRFELEAHLVARLQHPHIVPLLDYWRDPDGAYLVRQWLSGGSLDSALEHGPLAITTVNRMIDAIAGALAAAHRSGLAHGSLSSSDIRLDADQNFMLANLGIDRRLMRDDVVLPDEDVRALRRLVVECADHDELSKAARRVLADDPEATVDEFRLAWSEAIGHTDPAGSRHTPTRNPYKGLASFGEADAADFRGRADLSLAIVAAARERSLIALVGPSGVGKSSVLRAGVLPHLRAAQPDRFVVDLVPGRDPIDALAAAITRLAVRSTAGVADLLRQDGLDTAIGRFLPASARLLLIIDQFEELFTETRDVGERQRFFDLLCDATLGGQVDVALTLRADFFDRPLEHGRFGALLGEGVIPVPAPGVQELRSIIVEPAAALGIQWESSLVERMIAEVHDQAGALPLLEFALTRLFEDRDADIITLDQYEAGGGVVGAMVAVAEATLAELRASDLDTARHLFLRLVNVDGEMAVRRRARVTELHRLVGDERSTARVLDAFGAARLLTFDCDPTSRVATVEVAHEALIEHWPRLRGWLDQVRGDLPLHRRLAAATADWHANSETPDLLLAEGQLAQHEAWTESTDLQLTSEERAFVEQSRQAVDDARRLQRRRRHLVVAGLSAVAAIAMILAVTATVAQRNATEQADIADGRTLLAASAAVQDADPDLALLLALTGAESLSGDAEAATRLHGALSASRTVFAETWPGDPPGGTWGTMSGDGSKLVWSAVPGNVVEVRSVDTGDVLWRHEFEIERPLDLVLNPTFISDDREVAVFAMFGTDEDGADDEPPNAVGMTVFDVDTGEVLRRVRGNRCGMWLAGGGVGWGAVALQRPEEYVLVHQRSQSVIEVEGCRRIGDGTPTIDLLRIEVATSDPLPVLAESAVVGVHFSSMSADGRFISIDPFIGERSVIDVETGEVVLTVPDQDAFGPTALNHDGSLVVFGAADSNRFEVFSIDSGEMVLTPDGHADGAVINGAGFSDDGSLIHTTSDDATVRLWDTDTGRQVASISGAGAATTQARISADATRLSAFTFGPQVRVSSLDHIAEVHAVADCAPGGEPFRNNKGLTVRGDKILTHAACEGRVEPSTARVLERKSGRVLSEIPALGQTVGWSADGEFVVTQTWERDGDEIVGGALGVFDATGQRVVELDGLCDWSWSESSRFTNGFIDFADHSGPQCQGAPDLPFAATNWDIDVSPDRSVVAVAAAVARGAFVVIAEMTDGSVRSVVTGTDIAFAPSSEEFAVFNQQRRAIEVYDIDSVGAAAISAGS